MTDTRMESAGYFDVPVVLFCFKRIDTTLRILDRIAQVKPRTLYILSDEGRNDEEKRLVGECRRRIEEQITWDCTLVRNYAEENRGVYANIALGAKWIFQREKKAIFLEDDNLPEVTFFRFCEELLEKYEKDERVLWICGTNYLGEFDFGNQASYAFTRNILPCGWASWSDKFLRFYDGELTLLNDREKVMAMKKGFLRKPLYRQQLFNARSEKYRAENGQRYVSWDSQMAFSIRVHDLFGISPNRNQIKNIGVDEFSAHGGTSFSNIMTKRFCGMDSHPMTFPLTHPDTVAVDSKYEKKTESLILYPLRVRVQKAIITCLKRLLRIDIYKPLNLKKRLLRR